MMSRSEFELMIERGRSSPLDEMTPPTLDEWTEAIRTASHRRGAREIKERLRQAREDHSIYDPYLGMRVVVPARAGGEHQVSNPFGIYVTQTFPKIDDDNV